jgi:multicomponent Na+:H+ antiporter subunit D
MNQIDVIIPLLWQMVLSITLVFCWRRPEWHRRISVLGGIMGVLLAANLMGKVLIQGYVTMNAGNWPAPFGITMVADTFSATLVLLTSLAGLCVSIFSIHSILGNRISFGYFPVLHFLLMGLCGAFVAGDIFNLYVWFEIMIISSFVLLSLGGQKQQLEGAVKYFTLNMLASIIFLTAIAILYGLTGTLNMADLSIKMAAVENKTMVRITATIFLVGFGIKSAIFPLYFWLPASYHTPPAAVSAIFGGLLTKVGVYAMIRVFTLVFPPDPYFNNLLISVAIFSIVSGGLGALIQANIQRMFAYLIICHIGYMVLALGLGGKVALTGLAFYMIHDIVVKTNLFLVGGLIYQMEGHWERKRIGGLYADHPWLSLLMIIPLFSLVGIPPLSGFWPKISIINAGIDLRQYWAVGALLLGSFLTMYVIAKLWADVFWKGGGDRIPKQGFLYFGQMQLSGKLSMVVPIVILAVASLYIGFGAEQIQWLAERIATDLTHTDNYIKAVLKPVIEKGGMP